MADLTMAVSTEVSVEFTVGEKTAAWLEAQGWARPVVAPATDGVVDSTTTPSTSLEEAQQALDSREATRLQAQQLRDTLMGELSSPERVDELLTLCGVQMDRLLKPVVTVVVPAVDGAVDASAVS